MSKLLLGCAIIPGLAVVGVVVNYEFNPMSAHAQPASASPSSP